MLEDLEIIIMLTSSFDMKDILIFLHCLIIDVYMYMYKYMMYTLKLSYNLWSGNKIHLTLITRKSDFRDISSIVTDTPMKSLKLNVYPLKTVARAITYAFGGRVTWPDLVT